MADKQVPTGAGTVGSPLDTLTEGLEVTSNWVVPNPLTASAVRNGTNPAKHTQIRADVTMGAV